VKEVGAELIDPYDDLAQRTDQQLDIGFATKNKLGILVHDGYDTNKIKLFYRGVRSFYVEALTYARSHLPLDDPVLKNALKRGSQHT